MELDLDPKIAELAKERAEAGFPPFDRYLVRLPLRPADLAAGELRAQPIETTVVWTGFDGARYSEMVHVEIFEVTEFVRRRADLLYGPKGHNVGPGD